jgi:hypothetical protein
LAILLALIVLALGAWTAIQRIWLDNEPAKPMLVSPETTIFTSPRFRNGQVDYVSALNSEYDPPGEDRENLLAGVVEVVGPASIEELYDDSPPEVYWARLQVDPESPGHGWIPLKQFVSELPPEQLPDAYRSAHRSQEPDRNNRNQTAFPAPGETAPEPTRVALVRRRWVEARKNPWRPDDFPLIHKWIEANRNALDAFAQVARRRHYFNPVVPATGDLLPGGFHLGPVQALRDLTTAALVLVQREIGQGNIDKALDRTGELLHLARTMENSMTVTERALSMMIETSALRTLGQIAMAPSTGPEQLQAITKLIDELPERAPLARIVRNEVLPALEAVQLTWLTAEKDCSAPQFDVNQVLRVLVSDLNKHQAILAHPDPRRRRELQKHRDLAFENLYDDLEQLQSFLGAWWAKPLILVAPSSTRRRWQTELTGLGFSMLGHASYIELADQLQQNRTRLRILRVCLKVRLFQAKHQRWPRDLDELSRLGAAQIHDPFAQGPLTYQSTPEGFVVYSWGLDLKDDGATETDDVLRYPSAVLLSGSR